MGGDGENGDGFSMECSSSGMVPVFSSNWDPMAQHENNIIGSSTMVSGSEFANSSYSLLIQNQGVSSFDRYPSSTSYGEMVPKLPCYGSGSGSGSFPEMINPFARNYYQTKESGNEMALSTGGVTQENSRISEEAAAASPNGKRKNIGSNPNSPKNGEEEDEKQEVKKAKPASKKQVGKDNSQTGDYIHVRARRGQATNSHSLAERVRREKISERMRLLQELVPGCNKITGKAVMLDEIINYVQSLQQQVEFLSMKLATVNPDVNIDIERILSRDILHARSSNSPMTGFVPSHSHPYGTSQGTMPIMPGGANPHYPPFPQTILDNELHNLFQMGFDSTSGVDSLTTNAGRLKPEL